MMMIRDSRVNLMLRSLLTDHLARDWALDEVQEGRVMDELGDERGRMSPH